MIQNCLIYTLSGVRPDDITKLDSQLTINFKQLYMKIRTYGMKTVNVNGINIYCIRLGFKFTEENRLTIDNMIRQNLKHDSEGNLLERSSIFCYSTRNNKIVVESTLTCFEKYQENVKIIMNIAKTIAQNKLNNKYLWLETLNPNQNESNNN
jgi:hypothetical protein